MKTWLHRYRELLDPPSKSATSAQICRSIGINGSVETDNSQATVEKLAECTADEPQLAGKLTTLKCPELPDPLQVLGSCKGIAASDAGIYFSMVVKVPERNHSSFLSRTHMKPSSRAYTGSVE
jgi:hypothetical protein